MPSTLCSGHSPSLGSHQPPPFPLLGVGRGEFCPYPRPPPGNPSLLAAAASHQFCKSNLALLSSCCLQLETGGAGVQQEAREAQCCAAGGSRGWPGMQPRDTRRRGSYVPPYLAPHSLTWACPSPPKKHQDQKLPLHGLVQPSCPALMPTDFLNSSFSSLSPCWR